MIKVDIPCDVDQIKTNLIWKLNARQVICCVVALLIMFPTFFLIKNITGSIDVAIYTGMILCIPSVFFGFFKIQGLNFEEYLKYIYLHKKYNSQIRKYKNKGKSKLKKKDT